MKRVTSPPRFLSPSLTPPRSDLTLWSSFSCTRLLAQAWVTKPPINTQTRPLGLSDHLPAFAGPHHRSPSRPKSVSRLKLIPKANGRPRLLVDMHSLKKVTSKLSGSCDGPEETRSLAARSFWFLKFDLKNGYYHIMMSDFSLGFCFRRQWYTFARMPFGWPPAAYVFKQEVCGCYQKRWEAGWRGKKCLSGGKKIVLIPKKSDLTLVENWRGINLLNVEWKIFYMCGLKQNARHEKLLGRSKSGLLVGSEFSVTFC